MNNTATLIGASGLIGNNLLSLLLNDNNFTTVNILVRKTLPVQHQKLQQIIINFSNPQEMENAIANAKVVFCAIGTTMSKVKGDKELYKKIDYDIPVNAATIAAKFGVQIFVLVSAIGANAKSSNFYLKLKGMVEEKISAEAIPSIYIMQPSLLLGERAEKRLGERIAQAVFPALSTLMFGKFAKYKAINAEDVAKAMLMGAKENSNGIHILTYTAMMKLATGF